MSLKHLWPGEIMKSMKKLEARQAPVIYICCLSQERFGKRSLFILDLSPLLLTVSFESRTK